jgi:hypothetical protein
MFYVLTLAINTGLKIDKQLTSTISLPNYAFAEIKPGRKITLAFVQNPCMYSTCDVARRAYDPERGARRQAATGAIRS